MIATDLQARLLNCLVGVTELGLNWLVQSTLLIALGLFIGRLLRGLGAAAQSAIYRTTLIAVLCCPLVAWTLALSGSPSCSIPLPSAWTSLDHRIAPSDSDEEPVVANDVAPDDIVIANSGQLTGTDRATPLPHGQSPVSSPIPETGDLTFLPAASPLDPEPSPAVTSPELRKPPPFTAIGALLCLIWLAVTTVFLARLAAARRQLSRICRSAAEAERATRVTCREVASLLQIAPPDVRHSPFLSSPCLAGLRRPVVLLPERLTRMSLRDVLIHELAHLRRRDCHWRLLARLSNVVFFFQPLLWLLSRRLDATAEEICDDYVLHLGGDRREYAHRLLKIAAMSATPVAAAAVGIVSFRSTLARRVVRITDTSRRLSMRVGVILLASVLLGGFLCTTAIGLVRIAHEPPQAETEAEVADSVGTVSTESSDPESDDGEDDSADAQRGSLTVRGRIVDGDGKPMVGAHVAVIARRWHHRQGGDLSPDDEVLGEAITDELGNCVMRIERKSSTTYVDAKVVARADGWAVAGRTLNLHATSADVSLALPREEPIRGRLVDDQGRVAAGVRLSVWSVTPKTGSDRKANATSIRARLDNPLPAWLPQTTSDHSGRFVIRGVPEDFGVYFHVDGDDRFAPQGILLNTGTSERRGERDGTYRPLVKNFDHGEEARLTLAPARFFEGVVRYADTREPAPHARLTVWASQQEHGGSMLSIAGRADTDGRYRICPRPGVRFGLLTYPPDGSPYLIRTIRDIRWEDGERTKQVDITLPRGVLVRGKVVESETNAPVAGAAIQYVPERNNNPNVADDIITGWQGIQLSNERGEFEIAVLPGPGRLVVHGPTDRYVLLETSSRELSSGGTGGRRVYAHGIQKINPDENAEMRDVTILLRQSPVVSGQLVDGRGLPIEKAVMCTRLNVYAGWLEWMASPRTLLGGQFQVAGLAPGRSCPVYFLDAERRLGATAKVTAGSEPMRVFLEPCGQATMRFVDFEDKPLAGYCPTIKMIVTPGVSEDSPLASFRPLVSLASRIGLLTANAEYISNIDRTNYPLWSESDEQGRLLLPALIPGAMYEVVVQRGGRSVAASTFEARTNETLDLGDIAVDQPE